MMRAMINEKALAGRKGDKTLLLFLVEGLLPAVRAVFEDLHLRGMGLFVTGGEIIFVAAFTAFEDRLITFSSHSFVSLPFVARKS